MDFTCRGARAAIQEHRIDMKSPHLKTALRVALGIAAAASLAACANLHPSPDGPGNCVGPPDYCVPYFGASNALPDNRPPVSLANLHVSSPKAHPTIA
jgi:hypothetical protein